MIHFDYVKAVRKVRKATEAAERSSRQFEPLDCVERATMSPGKFALVVAKDLKWHLGVGFAPEFTHLPRDYFDLETHARRVEENRLERAIEMVYAATEEWRESDRAGWELSCKDGPIQWTFRPGDHNYFNSETYRQQVIAEYLKYQTPATEKEAA